MNSIEELEKENEAWLKEMTEHLKACQKQKQEENIAAILTGILLSIAVYVLLSL